MALGKLARAKSLPQTKNRGQPLTLTGPAWSHATPRRTARDTWASASGYPSWSLCSPMSGGPLWQGGAQEVVGREPGCPCWPLAGCHCVTPPAHPRNTPAPGAEEDPSKDPTRSSRRCGREGTGCLPARLFLSRSPTQCQPGFIRQRHSVAQQQRRPSTRLFEPTSERVDGGRQRSVPVSRVGRIAAQQQQLAAGQQRSSQGQP
jgi:hypothetical protein